MDTNRSRLPTPREGVTIKNIAFLLIALAMAAGGVFLARYAEADDSPGGVLIAIVVVIGAVVLGVIVLQRTVGSRQRD